MKRYYIFCDNQFIGSTATKEAAIKRIRKFQDNPMLLESEFSIIEGEKEVISRQRGIHNVGNYGNAGSGCWC